MMNVEEIVNNISNGDITMDELRDIVRSTLARIYCKLDDEYGLYGPTCVVKAIGRYPYDVNLIFIDGSDYSSGEYYEQTYRM